MTVAAALIPALAALNISLDPDRPVASTADLLALALIADPVESGPPLSAEARNAYAERATARAILLANIGFAQGDRGSSFGVDFPLVESLLETQLGVGLSIAVIDTFPKELRQFATNVIGLVGLTTRRLADARRQLALMAPPIASDVLEDLDATVSSIQGAMSDGPFAQTEFTLVARLKQSLTEALVAPADPAAPLVESPSILEAPAQLRRADLILRARQPSANVLSAIDAVVDGVQVAGEAGAPATGLLSDAVKRLGQVTGYRGSSEHVETVSSGPAHKSTTTLLARLQGLENRIRSSVMARNAAEASREARASCENIILVWQTLETLNQHAAALGLDTVKVSPVPQPRGTSDVVHLTGPTVGRWLDRNKEMYANLRAEAREAWRGRLADAKPSEHWLRMARRVRDEEAEELFLQARDLFNTLPSERTDEAAADLRQVEKLHAACVGRLRTDLRADAALAMRIEDAGGELRLGELSSKDLNAIQAIKGEDAIQFVLRIED